MLLFNCSIVQLQTLRLLKLQNTHKMYVTITPGPIAKQPSLWPCLWLKDLLRNDQLLLKNRHFISNNGT